MQDVQIGSWSNVCQFRILYSHQSNLNSIAGTKNPSRNFHNQASACPNEAEKAGRSTSHVRCRDGSSIESSYGLNYLVAATITVATSTGLQIEDSVQFLIYD
ncbi:hypothetical protein HRR83_004544 [Exophiala dermatitidis]|uniref:Uncharacterized protein n=1 Tax=Exophiala dermatitidis TaxID=5970 RepID=A0AAN6IXT0_EXODE|nr:hypothetical protein HRR74_004174 [Exophiala dermatitidis]KAJ4529247.1 hypothetical protein HRR73_000269 [Exophiala dermatitidis]KAJ4544102.1 hypothetical protein HRR76_002172 [Exophiala dermatitidis]KAJ4549281.1 hypothetical protein HRR77_004152 [Exophiala dermatitidis]KAJ4575570.1 hypothetical protein HRR79_002484 [Exophiala dermatitidis]